MACTNVIAALSSAGELLKEVFARSRRHIEIKQISKSGRVKDTIEVVDDFVKTEGSPSPSLDLAEKVDALRVRLTEALDIAAAPEWLSQVTAGLSRSAVDDLSRLVKNARAAIRKIKEAQDECEESVATLGPIEVQPGAAAMRILLRRWEKFPPDVGEIEKVSEMLLASDGPSTQVPDDNSPVLQRMCLTFGGQIQAVTLEKPTVSFKTATPSTDMFYDTGAILCGENPMSAIGGINFKAVRHLNSIRETEPVEGPHEGTIGRSDDDGKLYKLLKFPDDLGSPEQALASIMRGPSAELLSYNAYTNECIEATNRSKITESNNLQELQRKLESREHQATGDARLAWRRELNLSRLLVDAEVEDSLENANYKFSAF